MNKSLYTTSQVAKILAIKPYQFTYLLSIKGDLEPPRISGRRLFSQHDIHRLKKHFSPEETNE